MKRKWAVLLLTVSTAAVLTISEVITPLTHGVGAF
jgi:hypothetical protein